MGLTWQMRTCGQGLHQLPGYTAPPSILGWWHCPHPIASSSQGRATPHYLLGMVGDTCRSCLCAPPGSSVPFACMWLQAQPKGSKWTHLSLSLPDRLGYPGALFRHRWSVQEVLQGDLPGECDVGSRLAAQQWWQPRVSGSRPSGWWGCSWCCLHCHGLFALLCCCLCPRTG